MQQISAGCYRLSPLKYLKILKSYELKYNYSKTNILHEKSFLVALQGLEKEKKTVTGTLSMKMRLIVVFTTNLKWSVCQDHA